MRLDEIIFSFRYFAFGFCVEPELKSMFIYPFPFVLVIIRWGDKEDQQ